MATEPLPPSLPTRLANRALEREGWAREKLAPHADRTFTFTVGPIIVSHRIATGGALDDAAAAGTPDLALTLSPFDVPALLADPSRWETLVRTEGDAALAATLKELAQTLPWFVERVLEQAFGPVVGQRLADAGRSLLAFPQYAAERAAQNLGSFARDEARLLARGEEARTHAEQVQALAARVEALAARVARLSDPPSSR